MFPPLSKRAGLWGGEVKREGGKERRETQRGDGGGETKVEN